MGVDLDRLQRLLAEEADRPLGNARLASNRVNRAFSSGTSAAADNLLVKAMRRIETGDVHRARAFIERALGLPHDDYEDADPAVWSAHMFLFTAISDDLEGSDVGDCAWLDRAEAVIEASAPAAASEVRVCLRSLLSDAYDLSGVETRRIKALTRGVPFDEEPLAGLPGDSESKVAAIIDVLSAVIHHRRQLARRL